jgi:hypothetical protein
MRTRFRETIRRDGFAEMLTSGELRECDWNTARNGALLPTRRRAVNIHVPDRVTPTGPPKATDRRMLAAMIAVATVIVLALISFVVLSDFPSPTEGSLDKTTAPSEDVRR